MILPSLIEIGPFIWLLYYEFKGIYFNTQINMAVYRKPTLPFGCKGYKRNVYLGPRPRPKSNGMGNPNG